MQGLFKSASWNLTYNLPKIIAFISIICSYSWHTLWNFLTTYDWCTIYKSRSNMINHLYYNLRSSSYIKSKRDKKEPLEVVHYFSTGCVNVCYVEKIRLFRKIDFSSQYFGLSGNNNGLLFLIPRTFFGNWSKKKPFQNFYKNLQNIFYFWIWYEANIILYNKIMNSTKWELKETML